MYWDKITSLDRESTLAKRKFRQKKRWQEHMKQNEKEGIVVGGTGSVETLSSRSESGDSDRRSYI